jgi:hypothetical protein
VNKACSIFFFLFLTQLSFGQDSPDYYVQFKVESVSDKNDAVHIDKKMSSRKGIISTHTDHITSTYFCTMSGEAGYVFEDFASWFEKLGYEISCFNKGMQGDGGMVSPHELKNCEDSNN